MALASNALTTVANVKSFLQISVTTYDTLLELLVNSVSEWIENECGRVFKDSASNIVELHDGEGSMIFPRQWPINSIASIESRSGSLGAPTWTAYTTNDYTYDSRAGIIYFATPVFCDKQNIRLTYQGGFLTIPSDLELACIKMTSKEFDKRKSQGVPQEGVGGGSVTWNENVDPSAIKIIQKYRRFS